MIAEGLIYLSEWTLRASLLLAVVALLVFIVRRRAASLRHALWVIGIAGTLAIPFLSSIFPGWGILPSRVQEPAASFQAPDVVPRSISITVPKKAESDVLQDTNEAEVAPLLDDPRPIDWSAVLLAGWGLGAGCSLLRLLVGHCSIGLLVRGASRDCPALENCPSSVRITEREVPPMVCGLLCPTIILPIAALGWPRARLDAVLRHEQAHIRRGDLLWGWFAGLLCALQWFNPLVWFAAARMRSESEHACDDAVICEGIGAKEYAGHLLEVASTLEMSGRSLPTAAMASGPEVEGRLRYALDASRSRRALGRFGASGVALALAPLTLAFALANEVEAPKEASPRNEAEVERTPEPEANRRMLHLEQTIVLDPGHGGIDAGAAGNGSAEKDLNLKLAFALRERLERAGYRVVLTRFDDSTLSLDERVKIANRELGAVLLSLHFDGAPRASRPRYQLFTSPEAGPISTQLADSLFASLKSALPSDDIRKVDARFKVVREARIGAVLFDAPMPKPNATADAITTMADALTSGIVAWSNLPPPDNRKERCHHHHHRPENRDDGK